MDVGKVLAIWSAVCSQHDLRWFLFGDTLLCAEGYQQFPNMLDHAHIAVLGEDFSAIVQKVFPLLPVEWTTDKDTFCRGKQTLAFMHGEKVVLEISVLCGVENEGSLLKWETQTKRILRSVSQVRPWSVLCNVVPLLKQIAGPFVKRYVASLEEKAFQQMVALAGSADPRAPYYCDCLTSKTPVIIPAESIIQPQTLVCGGTEYPVFSAYQRYLTDAFGDYENGLTDEIGCGLTVEEKTELKEHQARCFEALTFLQQLSQELNLRYYLLAGSALGCVRHGGFIPWDDDIDVGIRIEDLARFEDAVKELLPERLPEGFALVQPGADNTYPRMFSKICYEGRCCIDLWPLVPTYFESFRAKLIWHFAKIITRTHYQKIGHPIYRYRKIVNILSRVLTDKQVMQLARRNERRYVGKNAPAYINLYSIYQRSKETIPCRWLDTEATAVFNGLEVPVVGCAEEYLTHLYGDYMAKPAPWKRASHHIARFFQTKTESVT